MHWRISKVKVLPYTLHTVSNGFDQKNWSVSMTNILEGDLTSPDDLQTLFQDMFHIDFMCSPSEKTSQICEVLDLEDKHTG